METEAFREWLKARRWNGKPLSTVSLRVSRVRKFEGAMPALGLGDADLDAAFEADGLEQVTAYLRDACRAAARTNAAPAALVGASTNPAQRLASLAAAVRNYRQFREADGEAPSAWPELDGLRALFLDRFPDFVRFDEPDNEYERYERVGKDRVVAQVQAIARSDDDAETAGRRIYRALMPNEGPFVRWQTDDHFARTHAEQAPDFYATIGRLARDRGPIVDAIMTAAAAFEVLRARGAAVLTMGEIFNVALSVAGTARPTEALPFKISKAQAFARLLIGDQIFTGSVLTREQVERWLDLIHRIEAVMRDEWHWHPRDLMDVQGFAWTVMDAPADDRDSEEEPDESPIWIVTARNGAEDGVDHFRERGEWHLIEDRGSRANELVREMQPGDRIVMRDFFGQKHNLPFDARGQRITALRIRATGTITEQPDNGLSVGVAWDDPVPPRTWYFYTNNDPVWRLRPEVEDARALAAFIFDGAAQDYDAFLARWLKDEAIDTGKDPGVTEAPAPTNLILYGPPGTGKTYATRRRAVALCGEDASGNDADVKAKYDALVDDKRIRFVTFHQSYAYEDFVEGLRPPTGPQDEGEGGFRLEVRPGVFREIATLAGRATEAARGGAPFDIGNRQVFKMSLGRAGAEDHIFDAAVEGGYIVLGWGGEIDWSPYDSYDAIHARWNEDHPGTNGNDGNIAQVARFRADMRKGDLVVVSYGNTRYRAIGEITGDYEYLPTETRDYSHRRAVKWLHLPETPQPVTFYDRPFTMRSCYLLREAHLHRAALALLLPGTGGAPSAPKPFVLICDEINRANISKVFGELITLLEGDKRIDRPNALKLQLPYSGETFGVPANLHVIGTMNTADRSIALLDTALRRRFTFEELMPDPGLLAEAAEACGIDLPRLLATLNDRIEYLFDREHQIGHAYFMHCRTRDEVGEVMRHKVIPLLAEYFYEDWSRVAAVLGDLFPDDGKEHSGDFLDRRPLKSPFADSEGATRYRWTVRDPANFAYAKLTAAA